MEVATLSRAALGSTAFLGDLYDARRDDFCGINVFQTSVSPTAINTQDSNFSDIHFVHSDNYSEKFSKMNVSADLQVSALCGMFALSGSGRYLSDTKESARTIKASLIYNIKTKEENVNIFRKELRKTFSLDAIKTDMATHVVVGISWGANSVVTCTYQNTENRDVKEIEGKLSAQLKRIVASASGNASIDSKEGDNSGGLSFDVRMYGDVLPQNEELPTTFQGALEFMKKLPTLVATSNDGKGKPLTFKLLPLSVVKKYLSVTSGLHVAIVKLKEAPLLRVVQLFDEISAAQQRFNDFFQDVKEYAIYVPVDKLEEIRIFKNKITILESSTRAEFYTQLLAIRSGAEDIAKLEETIQNFYSSEIAPSNISAKLESWMYLNRKIKFVRWLIKEGVKFLGVDEALDEKLLEIGKKIVYILYFTKSAQCDSPQIWKRNTHLFLKEVKNKAENTLYYAVDLDFHPSLKPEDRDICVQVFNDGECISADLFGARNDFAGTIAWMPESSTKRRGVHPHAVLAGIDSFGNPNYVCRASLKKEKVTHIVPGNLIVGKESKVAHIPYNGHQIAESYEVLLCPSWAYTWEKFNGTVPASAIAAGVNHWFGTLYIGRAIYKGGVVTGNLSFGNLFFCHENKEIKCETKYEILIRSPLCLQLGI